MMKIDLRDMLSSELTGHAEWTSEYNSFDCKYCLSGKTRTIQVSTIDLSNDLLDVLCAERDAAFKLGYDTAIKIMQGKTEICI